MHWPKPPGGLHIFLAYSVFNWEAVLPKALAPFGQVSEYEWRSLGYDELAPDWLKRRDQMNAEMLQAFHAERQRRPIDVVVCYASGFTVAPEVLQEMAAHGAVITNFCFDDRTRWPGPVSGGRFESTAAIAHAVDLNLTVDPDGIARYFAYGGLSMFHPEAADPEWYRPVDVPFQYDVSFIGSRFGWRPTLIEGLRRRGIDVACFGKGWANGPVTVEDMNRIYSASRINLGFGGVGHSMKVLCLKGRDFEVPMSGGLYLTQHDPGLSLVFDIGREILTYRDVDDCARIIRATLDDPAGAAVIRRAGHERSLREHTYLERWTRVFRTLGAIPATS